MESLEGQIHDLGHHNDEYDTEAHDRTSDNLTVQLLKAADSVYTPFRLCFMDSSNLNIDHHDAGIILRTIMVLKNTQRQWFMERLQKSRACFMQTVRDFF